MPAFAAAAVALLDSVPKSAFFTAPIIPFELYVAPDTTSTSVLCAVSISSITPFARLKKESVSPGALTISIAVIVFLLTVTFTVTFPPYPFAEPLYVPSFTSIAPFFPFFVVFFFVVSAIAAVLSFASSSLI